MSSVGCAHRLSVALAFVAWLGTSPLWAQTQFDGTRLRVPELTPPPNLQEYLGRPVLRVDVITVGGRWHEPVRLRLVRPGERYTHELVRRAMRELLDGGEYANASAKVELAGTGLIIKLLVLPRRTIAKVNSVGDAPNLQQALSAAGALEGNEITAYDLERIRDRIVEYYTRRGYPKASVSVDTLATDNPTEVVLSVRIDTGSFSPILKRRFQYSPFPALPSVRQAAQAYALEPGDPADLEALAAADRELERALKDAGFHRARVRHRLVRKPRGTELTVVVLSGPRIRIQFEGNRHLDRERLLSSLAELEQGNRAEAMTDAIRETYIKHGFFDVEVEAILRGRPDQRINDLVIQIREGERLTVVDRKYPCLSGERSARQVQSEIDSFLSEGLPGSELLGPVDPRAVDATLGPQNRVAGQAVPLKLNPWSTYHPGVYERALTHLKELYRSEGYLSAEVGPITVERATCPRGSSMQQCRSSLAEPTPFRGCSYDKYGIPKELAEGPILTCTPAAGRRCSSQAVLHIPIRLGPRTNLFDIGFEGNQRVPAEQLHEELDLELGAPVNLAELERARRRVLDVYEEAGFAYAEVELKLDLSPDHTRGRARFIVHEREPVRVARIVVQGAHGTRETLIRSRIALEQGGLYRRSLVRKTEERLATLTVFSSVSVGLQDPYVPAREKVVLITVHEKKAQYLEVRPGFSTGEGFRITFEYGHRNLAGSAVQLTLRSQLGLLPNALILDDDVRANYGQLDLSERLERRNTARIVFPDIGLGPLFRLNLEGVDVRDNARDFGLTKDAGIVSLLYHPIVGISAELALSLELNDARIFGGQALQDYIEEHPEERDAFRVPEGKTRAVAQRLTAAWDRRDNKLAATSGTLVSLSVEHVRADPIGEGAAAAAQNTSNVFAPATSQFLRYTNRLSGYLRLGRSGTALAVSFRWGYIQQLFEHSRTYPDRLFFLGGVDSLRGFLQDSVIPEDVAEQVLSPNSDLSVRQVVIRGGDIFVNPRAELRIPMGPSLQTALFLDAGNLWTDPAKLDPLSLRYAFGTGLRIATPIGPLVFDYGFNLDRILDELDPSRTNQRFWEDLGAFHFSVGVF